MPEEDKTQTKDDETQKTKEEEAVETAGTEEIDLSNVEPVDLSESGNSAPPVGADPATAKRLEDAEARLAALDKAEKERAAAVEEAASVAKDDDDYDETMEEVRKMRKDAAAERAESKAEIAALAKSIESMKTQVDANNAANTRVQMAAEVRQLALGVIKASPLLKKNTGAADLVLQKMQTWAHRDFNPALNIDEQVKRVQKDLAAWIKEETPGWSFGLSEEESKGSVPEKPKGDARQEAIDRDKAKKEAISAPAGAAPPSTQKKGPASSSAKDIRRFMVEHPAMQEHV